MVIVHGYDSLPEGNVLLKPEISWRNDGKKWCVSWENNGTYGKYCVSYVASCDSSTHLDPYITHIYIYI